MFTKIGRYGYNGNSSGIWVDSEKIKNRENVIPMLTKFGRMVVKLNSLKTEEEKYDFVGKCKSNLTTGEWLDLLREIH